MTEPQYRAWLVDLDGTLYRALPLKLAMGLELGLLGGRSLAIVRRFRREHERLRREQSSPVDSPYALQVARTAEALGLEPAAVERVVTEWMITRPAKWLRALRRQRLLDEIGAFRGAGGRTALVSDYPASVKLRALGADHLFDAVVANGEPDGPRRLKPYPDGMLSAADKLGVAPSECLVIGDRDDADGAAAQAAGMSFRRVG
ncbi:MAG: HAD family hydrolase [Polyangiaceae bacterium]|nr:HAD family hydrolase [Polyangiaceae bacterium]